MTDGWSWNAYITTIHGQPIDRYEIILTLAIATLLTLLAALFR